MRLVEEQGVDAALLALEPDYRQYQLLKEQLNRYRQLAEEGGWHSVKIEQPIEPGDRSAHLPAILQRLGLETDIKNTDVRFMRKSCRKSLNSPLSLSLWHGWKLPLIDMELLLADSSGRCSGF